MIPLVQDRKETVQSLLNKLVDVGNNISWRNNNTYSKNLDQTILEIQIFEQKLQTGRIAFELEDGHVINYRYKDLEKRTPVQIVDMLLDVIGYELSAA
jgi:hypothetical protein